MTFSGHDLEHIGAKVGNQDVAVGGKRQAIGQGAGGEFGFYGIVARRGRSRKVRVGLLANEVLLAVRVDAGDATAGIGHPQAAVGLGQNAFGALQVVPHPLDGRA